MAGSVAHDGPSLSGDAAVDAAVDAAIPPCQMPIVSDNFQGTTPCSPWGSVTAGGFTSQGGGSLVIALPPNTAGAGGCAMLAPTDFGASGTFVEVTSLLAGSATSTTFELSSSMSLLHLYFDAAGGMLTLKEDNLGTVAVTSYDAIAMRWWRLRPSADRLSIVAEVAPDGKQWQPFGSVALAAPAMVYVLLDARVVDTSNASPGMTTFQQFDICQP